MRIAAVLLFSLAGCGVVAGTLIVSSAIAYGDAKIQGSKAYSDYRVPRRQAWDAMIDELGKYDVKLTNQRIDEKEEVASVDVNGHRFYVFPHPADKSYTRVQLTIGAFDQREKTRIAKQFLLDLGARLGPDSQAPEFPGAKPTDKPTSGTATSGSSRPGDDILEEGKKKNEEKDAEEKSTPDGN